MAYQENLATNSSSVQDGCDGGKCADVDNADMTASGGLPYLILIITLVLCSILLATIALIIIVVVTRHRRRRLDSMEDTAISYDDLAKPGLTAMEVQPDLRALEPRGDPRGFMPFAPFPPRRFGPQAQYDDKRRLITVPEEEGSGSNDESCSRQSQEDLYNFAAYEYNSGTLGDADGEGEGDGEAGIQSGGSAASTRRMIKHMRGRQTSGLAQNMGSSAGAKQSSFSTSSSGASGSGHHGVGSGSMHSSNTGS
ncbi:hypothetical protein EGW08_003112 [Elysia chlorotica]|uniref:Uncharacterized protein n=1 Tax=Elysia chlorotica TaxID=188477 RepID=A0A3S1CCP7_ELYCH|nr:hypothetical protein EGW08_003112 [Elysia chlorotica]